MATIVSKVNELEQKYLRAKKLSTAGYVLTIGCCFLLLPAIVLFCTELFLVACVGVIGGAVLAERMHQKANIYQAGYAGEQATAQIISSLPEQYFGVPNLKVSFDGKTSELDMVVVGPTGVFVVETKNLHGTIVGDYDSRQWSHNKVSHQGNEYTKSLYSPVKQVGTHVYRLAKFLRSNGIYTRVESAVYFSDPETVVDLNGETKQIPVFSAREDGRSALQAYITNRNVRIAEAQVGRILRLLHC